MEISKKMVHDQPRMRDSCRTNILKAAGELASWKNVVVSIENIVYNIPYRRALGLAAECAHEQRYLTYNQKLSDTLHQKTWQNQI